MMLPVNFRAEGVSRHGLCIGVVPQSGRMSVDGLHGGEYRERKIGLAREGVV